MCYCLQLACGVLTRPIDMSAGFGDGRRAKLVQSWTEWPSGLRSEELHQTKGASVSFFSFESVVVYAQSLLLEFVELRSSLVGVCSSSRASRVKKNYSFGCGTKQFLFTPVDLSVCDMTWAPLYSSSRFPCDGCAWLLCCNASLHRCLFVMRCCWYEHPNSFLSSRELLCKIAIIVQ